jgi:hypothetical protein
LETDREERKAERKAYQQDLKKMMEGLLKDKQDKLDAWLGEKQDGRKEMTEANPERLKTCQETTAYHEATKAGTERTETDPGMMQSVGEHQEVPKEEAAVMPVG